MIKIIVVEDDLELNKIVSNFLSTNGFNVMSCLNPMSAYDAMYNNLVDLIISDIMMPNVDGFEFAETVRAMNKKFQFYLFQLEPIYHRKQKAFN